MGLPVHFGILLQSDDPSPASSSETINSQRRIQLGIFAIIFVAGAVILLMSVHILFWIDILKELLEKCRNE